MNNNNVDLLKYVVKTRTKTILEDIVGRYTRYYDTDKIVSFEEELLTAIDVNDYGNIILILDFEVLVRGISEYVTNNKDELLNKLCDDNLSNHCVSLEKTYKKLIDLIIQFK